MVAKAILVVRFSAQPEAFFVYGSHHPILQKVLTSSRKVDECQPLHGGLPVDSGDYDFRTTLHLSAAEGNLKAGAYTTFHLNVSIFCETRGI
jgi:hypothetical protein